MGQAAGALVAAERHVADLAEQKVGVSSKMRHSCCAQAQSVQKRLSVIACNAQIPNIPSVPGQPAKATQVHAAKTAKICGVLPASDLTA